MALGENASSVIIARSFILLRASIANFLLALIQYEGIFIIAKKCVFEVLEVIVWMIVDVKIEKIFGIGRS